MADIFISYKREEQPIAKKLADALQMKGWKVWWDPEIRAGERFDDVIEKALIESKCVVVLWSKLSVESQNVKDEATYALNREKLVPILIEEVNLPFRFERINTGQLIDWDGSDTFPGFQKLIADVISILGEPPVEEEKRKREQAEREAEKELRRKQEAERKLREDEKNKAEKERQRLEEEQHRLAEEKREFEEEQKRIEAAHKTEEERKQMEDEATRKAEEEKLRTEKEELKRKSEEEERKRKEAEAKPHEPEPVKIKPAEPKTDTKATTEPKPHEPSKPSNALKFGAVAGVAVLLIVGIWWWVSQQQVKEVRQKLEKLDSQASNLEIAVSELNRPEQIEEFARQSDTLSQQVDGLSEQATKVGLESQLEQLQKRLKPIQDQLASKKTEFNEVRQTIEKLDKQALNLENAIAKFDNPEQIEGLQKQKDALSHQVEGLSEQATKVGLESQLEQLQNRLEQVQIQLANKEKELIAARKGKIFVPSVPENATVKILDIDEPFKQGMELTPGKYHVQVSSEGYEPQERWVEIGASEEKRINFELKKITPKVARLHVETVPKDATVRILNIKPEFFQGMELEPGDYRVEVAAGGYETERKWIALVGGQEEPFRVELEKIKVAKPTSSQKAITNSIGMKFVLIPAGKFVMGSQLSPEEVARRYGGEANNYEDEHPPHPVEITKPFYLQTTEVTVGQWRKFTEETGYKTDAETGRAAYIWEGSEWKKKIGMYWDNPGHSQDDRHPVSCVSWNDVQEFIRWLNRLNRKEDTDKHRLPTEAEWEYACRAKKTMPFSTGKCISTDQANYNGRYPGKNCPKGEYREKTVKVGSFQPNAWGLYDMHGNVWEWCQDWYGDYPSNTVVDPTGLIKGEYRVLRGGSWGSNARDLRSADRFRFDPDPHFNSYGFRVARDF